MVDIESSPTSIPFEIWDAALETGITTNSNTLSFDLGGGTPITGAITFSQTSGFLFNAGQDDLDAVFSGTTRQYLIYVDAGNNSVGFNTNDPTFIREGVARESAFGVLRDDSAASNNNFFALATNNATRAVDTSILLCRGTWAAKEAVQNNDVIYNLGMEGHDGTDFNRSAAIRAAVDGTVSSNTVPTELLLLTSATNSGGLANRLRLRSNGLAQFGGGRGTPEIVFDTTTGAATFNAQQNTANFIVLSSGDANMLFVDGTNDKVGISTNAPASTFDVAGSRGLKVTTLNAATLTLDETHEIIHVTYTATGAVTITLPTAASCWNSTDGVGRVYTIVDAAGNAHINNITITPNGSETINGSASALIATDYNSLTIYTNGSNWFIK